MNTYYEILITKIYTDTSDIVKRLGDISEDIDFDEDFKEEAKEEILELTEALTSDIYYFEEKVMKLKKLIKEGEKHEV